MMSWKLLTAFLVLIVLAWRADGKEIEGKILSETNGENVENVNVFTPDSTLGCVSGKDGSFLIKNINGNHRLLVFSHISYHTKVIEIPKGKTNKLIVKLEPKVISWGEDVLVTAARTEKKKSDLTVPAFNMSKRRIEEEIPSNMADLLHNTPGFRQVWEYHSPLLLRGMSSRHILTLMDGCRRIGTFPGGFMGQNMNVFDAGRIEVVRGPASVVHGAGAISGAINVISPDPFEFKHRHIKTAWGYGSNNNELLSLLWANWHWDRYYLQVSGKLRHTDDYKMGDGEKAVNSEVEDKDMGARLGVELTEKQKMVFSVKYHDGGPWGKPLGFNNKPWVKVNNEEVNQHYSVHYKGKWDGMIREVSAKAFYDKSERDYYKRKLSVVTGRVSTLNLVEYGLNYGGGRVFALLKPMKGHLLNMGVDGYASDFESPETVHDYTDNTKYPVYGSKDAGVQSFGMFIKDELISPTKRWAVDGGVRFDYARISQGELKDGTDGINKDKNAVSGSFGLLFRANEKTSLTLNLGRAFRMPDMNEMFNTITSCVGVKKGNAELDPEYSWNVDLGVKGNFRGFDYDLALFTNFLADFINQVGAPENADYDLTYENIGEARISGAELTCEYHFNSVFDENDDLRMFVLTEYIYGADVTDEDGYFSGGDPLLGIPPFRFVYSARYSGLGRLWDDYCRFFLEAEGEYTGDQDRVPDDAAGPWGTEETESFFLVNLKGGCCLPTFWLKPSLSLSVNNLFDEEYRTLGAYLPAMGRNVKLMLKINF